MRIKSGVVVGEGLFALGTVDVEVEFPAGVAVFKMRALTPELMAKLQGEGISFEGLEQDAVRALDVAKRVLSELVEGWENLNDIAGNPIEFNDENRNKLATIPAISQVLWKAASNLAVEQVGAEEKN